VGPNKGKTGYFVEQGNFFPQNRPGTEADVLSISSKEKGAWYNAFERGRGRKPASFAANGKKKREKEE